MAYTKHDALAHANPQHIKSIVDSVLHLYFRLCGCSHEQVYVNNLEGECHDWDDLQQFLEDVYDGIPEIRGWRRDGELEEPDAIPDTERGR